MKALIRRSIVVFGAAVAVVASARARPVIVTGTGNPTVDIPAVQAAVDQGGDVILTGHFSFDADPTTPPGADYARIVTVSKAVVISGTPDANGDIPTINRLGCQSHLYIDFRQTAFDPVRSRVHGHGMLPVCSKVPLATANRNRSQVLPAHIRIVRSCRWKNGRPNTGRRLMFSQLQARQIRCQQV